MKNFRRIKKELNLDAVREELHSSDLWLDMDARPNRPKTYANTDRIQLRTNQIVAGKSYHDIHETRDLSAWHALGATRQFVLDFLAEVGGELGHVRVTSLRGGHEIPAHVDIGEYCAIRDRYHLVVTAPQGTLFNAGDESIVMRENELWWFDNKQMHAVKNLGDAARIHVVFDILHHQAAAGDATYP